MPPKNSPYKKQASAQLDQRAAQTMRVDLLPDEAHAVVARMQGACPSCEHETSFDSPLVAIQGVDAIRETDSVLVLADELGRSSGSEDIRGHCLCGETHEGQPDDERGCGARWGIHVSWGSG